MRQELDERLCREFPILYRDRRGDMRRTSMCWGFTIGDGWFQIVYDLSKKIEAYDPRKCTCPDWMEGPHQRNENCPKNGPRPVAGQVKEKFGTLRFYVDYGDDAVYAMVREAEVLSAKTCEECGAIGCLRAGGWLRTLCDGCHIERQTKRRAPR